MNTVRYVIDAECGEDFIEVTLTNNSKHWINTTPKGDWQHLKLNGVNFADFLRTMVEPNLEVNRKIANLELQQTHKYSIRAMRCLRILDSSFDVPYINKNSEWQMMMVSYMNQVFGFAAIDQCNDQWALMTYANMLRAVR
jgi:hypothetical protein